jgi:hypothetical protein
MRDSERNAMSEEKPPLDYARPKEPPAFLPESKWITIVFIVLMVPVVFMLMIFLVAIFFFYARG